MRLPEGEALQCLTERAMAWQVKNPPMKTDKIAQKLKILIFNNLKLHPNRMRKDERAENDGKEKKKSHFDLLTFFNRHNLKTNEFHKEL